MRISYLGLFLTLLPGVPLLAQAGGKASTKTAASDSDFKAMQERGKKAMGVDQYTSTHRFDALPTGGRIELQRKGADSAGVAQVRAHIREIATAFKSGDFSTPGFVHMQTVPGTTVMREKRSVITYEPRDLARGAELIIRTKDAEALRAIHEFITFQRGEHRTGGMGAMKHDR